MTSRTAFEITENSNRVPALLELHNVHAGDVVAISAKNSTHLLSFVDGCLRLGVIPAVLSSSATDREVNEMASDVGAKVILRTEEIESLGDFPRGPDLASLPKCRPIHFTSGTSGRPKAVWSGWLSAEHAKQWIREEHVAWDINAQDTHLVCGPLSHSAPLRFALMTLWAGGSVAAPPKFRSDQVMDLLNQVTTTFMAPIHMQRILEVSTEPVMPHSLRLLAHAGAACPDRVRTWAHKNFGLDIVFEFYGSTEGQFTFCSARDWLTRPGSVGRARTGRVLRSDNEGRLWCHVPEHARFEYWKDPEKTSKAWDGEWFTVGDYGYIDDEGYVFLHGRKGDLIISGGVNVYPSEIERVLADLEGVSQAVAFGQPDDNWGERVCLVVEGTAQESAIREYLASQLSAAKRPKDIFFMDSLPLTHSGKVDRAAITSHFNCGH